MEIGRDYLFRDNMRELMRVQKLSFRGLAELTGVSFSTINSISRGSDPTVTTALKIATALGKTIDQMVRVDYTKPEKERRSV